MPRAKTKLTSVPKRSKYGNVKTEAGGFKHASKKQALRWVLLRQWEREGKIRNLKREVSFPILVKGEKICDYRADHVYETVTHDFCGGNVTIWDQVVEDVKGVKTDVYKLKKKLMRAVHGIDIKEV